MDLVLNIGIPVLIIVAVSQLVQLRMHFTLLLVVVLGFISTEIVDYLYCSILKTQCELDALNRVGMFIHSCIVIFLSLLLHIWIARKKSR